MTKPTCPNCNNDGWIGNGPSGPNGWTGVEASELSKYAVKGVMTKPTTEKKLPKHSNVSMYYDDGDSVESNICELEEKINEIIDYLETLTKKEPND